jgi:hypothetical protein
MITLPAHCKFLLPLACGHDLSNILTTHVFVFLLVFVQGNLQRLEDGNDELILVEDEDPVM